MTPQYKTFLHRWFDEVWNQRREDAIDELFAADAVANGLTDTEGRAVRGCEGFKALHRAFLSAYPDLHITVEDTVSEGDKIAARLRFARRTPATASVSPRPGGRSNLPVSRSSASGTAKSSKPGTNSIL
jgi:predicted ester cyclase